MALDNNTLTVNENTITQDSEDLNEIIIKRNNLHTDPNYHPKWKKEMIVFFAVIHLGAIYGLYLTVTLKPMMLTLMWAYLLVVVNIQGILLGAHRGYSHKSFKLTTAAEILLLIFQTTSGQGPVYCWARDHRLHHKYESTDADPYNIRRGFFFSHIGWLMSYKHPLILQKGKQIDMSDLEKNKLVMFQNKHIVSLMILFCVVIPVIVPILCWGENYWNSLYVCFFLRYCYVVNCSASINSFAHWRGSKPFDGRVTACEWAFPYGLLGAEERTHNYHHAFPYDPSFTEFGLKAYGTAAIFLRCLQRIGWVYDLKVVPESLIYKHSKRYGDGSFTLSESDLKAKRIIPKNNSW